MKKRINTLDMLVFAIIILLAWVTLTGITSFDTTNSYMATNQYGHDVMMFGSGIYSQDSYFRAPIFIGSDITMLFLVIPLLIAAQFIETKRETLKSGLFLSSILAVVLYYATSIVFGVTYNALHLAYIALFACSLFAFVVSVMEIDKKELRNKQSWSLPSRGIRIFLILTGIALFGAWLPDIIPTIVNGTTLPLIEVYTTEITYVLDMGIVSPLVFICLHLLKKKDGLGDVLLAVILTLCVVMGVMIPVQSIFQVLAGIELPIQVLVTKVGVFVILAAFATYFDIKLFRGVITPIPPSAGSGSA